MSYRVRALVQACPAFNRAGPRRDVLMALADRASDDGTGAWPSINRLCSDSGWARRTVINARAWLEREGWIVRVGRRSCRGGYTIDWRIDLARLTGAEVVHVVHHLDTEPVHSAGAARAPLSSASGAPEPIHKPILESPLPPQGGVGSGFAESTKGQGSGSEPFGAKAAGPGPSRRRTHGRTERRPSLAGEKPENSGVVRLHRASKVDERNVAAAFDELWTHWARKDQHLRSARKLAERVYVRKIRRGADPIAVLNAAKAFLASPATREYGRFMPTLQAWLREERWADRSPPPARKDERAEREQFWREWGIWDPKWGPHPERRSAMAA